MSSHEEVPNSPLYWEDQENNEYINSDELIEALIDCIWELNRTMFSLKENLKNICEILKK